MNSFLRQGYGVDVLVNSSCRCHWWVFEWRLRFVLMEEEGYHPFVSLILGTNVFYLRCRWCSRMFSLRLFWLRVISCRRFLVRPRHRNGSPCRKHRSCLFFNLARVVSKARKCRAIQLSNSGVLHCYIRSFWRSIVVASLGRVLHCIQFVAIWGIFNRVIPRVYLFPETCPVVLVFWLSCSVG